jgi:hypothetical protein
MNIEKTASNETRISKVKIQLVELNSNIKTFEESMAIFNRRATAVGKTKDRF